MFLAHLLLLVGLSATAVFRQQLSVPDVSSNHDGKVEYTEGAPAGNQGFVEDFTGATGEGPGQQQAVEQVASPPARTAAADNTGELPAGNENKRDTPAQLDEGGKVVNVAVVGRNGELLFGPAPVRVSSSGRWGCTALGALAATGLPYELAPGWNAFVEAVAGQRNRGSSGWMYKVNEEVPMVGADKKQVAAGDRVIWWYSKSIDTPPPTWENVCK